MTLDIQKARNFIFLNKSKKISSGFYLVLYAVSIILLIVAILIFILGRQLLSDSAPIYLRLAELLSGLSLVYLFFYKFAKSYFSPYAKIDSDNLAETLSPPVAEVMIEAKKMSVKNGFSEIPPIILLASLERNVDGKYMLLRAGFGIEKDLSGTISEAILKIPRTENQNSNPSPTPELTSVLEAARQNAISNSRGEVTTGDILLGLIQKSDIFKNLMFEIKIDEEDIKRVVEWHEILKSYQDKQLLPFWEKAGIVGGIGRDWSFGYTQMLNQFARNLNTEIEFSGEIHVYGRSHELEEIERILAKTGRNNVLLVGDQGIGKKTIVKGFVSKIIKGQVLPSIKYSQVFQVDTGAILSGSGDSGEIAGRIKRIFNEAARAGNIILFFDNFHALVSREEGVGKVNTAEIILPYLNGAVRVIGATGLKEFHRDIESSPGVAAAFDKVEVKEPNTTETGEILEEMIPIIEHRDGVFWPYQSVKEVVRVCDRFIHNKPAPEKEIGVVDEVSVSVAKLGKKIVLNDDIDKLVSAELEVPVQQAEGEEAKKLLNLEEFLHKRVIGQNEAIAAVSNAMRRARSGIQDKNRPIGTFLFLGPTGVGKTETSKALAEAYFGSDKSMIRLDMSEFQEQSSIYRMIGSPPSAGNEGEKGQLTTAVEDNPFSLILLDELEKAHPEILTLFLQVLDDGRLTDGTGKVVDFTNTILIATSNAGSEVIRESLLRGVRGEELKNSLLTYLQEKGIFKPEFLNRFDAVVAFHPLSEDEIKQVARLMLASLSKTMAEKEITLDFTDQAVEKLAKAGFDPVYGARPMRRAIQEKVENVLAENLLKGEIPRGSKITINEENIL